MTGVPNIAFPPKVLAGLAVSAVSDGQIATATLSNVTLDGNPITALGGRTIGFVNEQGSESFGGGVWTVNGSRASAMTRRTSRAWRSRATSRLQHA